MKKLLSIMLAGISFLTSTSLAEETQIKENKMNTTIHFYRNATMKIKYAGNTILTDPMFAKKGTFPGFLYTDKLINPTSELTVPKEEIIAETDFILLSHTHVPVGYNVNNPAHFSDHMDSDAIKTISKNMPIYLPEYDFDGMTKQGFTNLQVIKEKSNINNILVSRFDGLHVDDETWIPMIGESSGYVLKAKSSPTILWSGDTLLTQTIKDQIIEHQPDVIILHPGGAQMPKDDKGNVATLLMGIEDTIEIAKLAPKAKIIAIHMEALDHCTVKKVDLREAANKAGIEKQRLIIPNNGELISL